MDDPRRVLIDTCEYLQDAAKDLRDQADLLPEDAAEVALKLQGIVETVLVQNERYLAVMAQWVGTISTVN